MIEIKALLNSSGWLKASGMLSLSGKSEFLDILYFRHTWILRLFKSSKTGIFLLEYSRNFSEVFFKKRLWFSAYQVSN